MQNLIVLKLYYSLMKELNTEISVLLPKESDASNLKFKSNFGFFVELYSWNIEGEYVSSQSLFKHGKIHQEFKKKKLKIT